MLGTDSGAAGVTDAGTVPSRGTPARHGVLGPEEGVDGGGDHRHVQRHHRGAGRVLSEKIPNFVMNAALFAGSYGVGFALMWKLVLPALPSVLLLIIPGFIYGGVVIGLARRSREQYTHAGAIAEQAISSVRTVYSFVAERTTMAQFSAALEKSVRLGLKQGLAKGVAIGSNGIAFAILAFNVWYGSRLVMYHGYQGGTVFAVSFVTIRGGLCVTPSTYYICTINS